MGLVGLFLCGIALGVSLGIGIFNLSSDGWPIRMQVDDTTFTAHKTIHGKFMTNSKYSAIGMKTDRKNDWWEIGTSYNTFGSKKKKDAIYKPEGVGQYTRPLGQVYARGLRKAAKAFNDWLKEHQYEVKRVEDKTTRQTLKEEKNEL